ncbi:hypothetical protein ILUMI_21025 [Ignelater luminosus]|uniref:EDR1/CTR1/ARMC3-like peptidase-like domain-containing protein n=1 Tax=Ignelater luminosus TaxID=2038154 RepID=A0A8K0G426_IGNLU|nr:hypothetical protein ILUMI_21025 [Ignelater luminosus]
MECLETASYFVKSLEFIQFCQWATSCPKKFILPSALIITSLTKLVELRQLLFDFSIEDTVLSFFRINNELVFYKTCEAISNMSSHRYCCEKMITPVVIQCLLQMLTRSDVPIIPYHEIALKTLYDLLRRDGRTLKLIIACGGIPLLTTCWLRDKKEYTHETLSVLMEMLYIFSADAEFRKITMNSMLYQMLLNTFDDVSDFSRKALLVLNQYVDDSECRQYFLEFEGPQIVLKQISSTPDEKTLKDILIFLQRIFLYKKVGMAFLLAGCLAVLNSICDEAKEAIPLINQLISMMYDLYLPIKFHELGRLEITDHLTSRFYLINGVCAEGFPFLEILTEQNACPINIIYIVDFTANVDELTRKPIKIPSPLETRLPSTSSIPPNTARKSGSQTRRRSSILKNTSGAKTQRVSIQINDSLQGIPATEERQEAEESFLTCQVPPPINFGCISEDPYLPKYAEKLKLLLYSNKKYIICFQHQVKLIAHFVSDVLSGPDGASDPLDSHCLDFHLTALKEKLGTNLIPIGYLRCGHYCERALLFKALAEKVGVPCTLVRGRDRVFYWNEVPITNEEPYANLNDEQKTYLSYAVVDLINKVGELMLVGSVEANKYCGLLVDTDRINATVNAIKVDSEVDLHKHDNA